MIVEYLVGADEKFAYWSAFVELGEVHGKEGLFRWINGYEGLVGSCYEGRFALDVEREWNVSVYVQFLGIGMSDRDMKEDVYRMILGEEGGGALEEFEGIRRKKVIVEAIGG